MANDYESGRRAFKAYWEGEEVTEDPLTDSFSRGAIDEFEKTWAGLGRARESLIRGREKAGEKRVRPIDGLLELLQNADDQGATAATLLLSRRTLRFVHNGSRVTLRNVAPIVMPYLTTKDDEPDTIGRFGIGLKTLSALGTTLDVHCAPYHFTADSDGPHAAKAPRPIEGLYRPDGRSTLFVLRLHRGALTPRMLDAWLDELGVPGIVFLSHLRTLKVVAGRHSRELRIRGRKKISHRAAGGRPSVEEVRLTGGGGWRTYTTLVAPPAALERTGKARASKVEVGIALSNTAAGGRICVGLPIERRTGMPISLNAPFDPDDSRRDLRETAWNEWLFEELAVLASRVVDLRYEDAPASVWRAVPTPDESVTGHDWLDDRLSGVRRAAADALASIEFQPPDPDEEPSLIEEGAYEPEWLDGLVSPAQLTIHQRAVLPEALRNGLGRWRKVLRESHLGRELEPEEVISFAGSPDEDLQTPAPGWWASLTSAFLSHGAEADLKDAATIVLDDGRRVTPADVDAGLILTREQTDAPVPVVATLHAAYLSNRQFAPLITKWLEDTGRLATKLDNPRLLRALADWEGDAHNLEDAALVWLQRALWSLEDDGDREGLGTRIGRRVALDGHWFDEGSRRHGPIVVGDSYLPPAFTHVRDSFARAAGDAPDLSWIAVRYEKVLRPSAERAQDGALATLRLLGARAAPPLKEGPGAEWARYAGGAPAYHLAYDAGRLQEYAIGALPGPPTEALQGDRGAEDLLAVARHIEQETDEKKRQVRARALFATLSREWLGSYADGLRATAVEGYHGWNQLGNVPTTWRSELADIEWLTGPRGEPAAPYDLALRTAALEAAHGDNEPYAVEADASLAHATDLAAALGMSVQPAASGLVDELRNLRDVSSEYTQDAVAQKASGLLRALALLCPPADSDVQRDTMIDDRSAAQLRGYFGIRRGRPGLIYHDGRWWPPSGAVLGNRVFGRHRVALQQDPEVLGRLWNVLDIHPPRMRDCVAVLGEMAEHDLAPGETGTYIGILRLLNALADGRRIEDLRGLPIWCGDAWRTHRPIYASYDPGLAESLRSEVPVWEPRCSLDTLGDLPRLMNVSILDAQQLTPSGIDSAATSQGSLYRSLFSGAVEHFRDLCATVDPDLYGALEHDWQNLADAKLAVSPNLSCTGQLGRRQVTVSINTYASKTPALLAACDSALLGSEQMGTSLAASWVRGEDALGVDYFKAGVLWAKAWQRSLDGLPAQGVELAERVASDDDLAVLQAKISGRDLPPPRERGAGAGADDTEHLEAAVPVRLKDAAMLVPNPPTTVGSNGRGLGTTHTTHQELATREEIVVARATSGESRPRRRTVPDRDPQDVAMEILKVALRSSESNELDDLREVRGIGADAIDDLLGFIEMKHDVREPPDQVVLLRSQQLRGREMKSNFILAVVSGLLEGSRTVVRLYPDPLGTLEFEAPSSLTLRGLRSSPFVEISLDDRSPEAD